MMKEPHYLGKYELRERLGRGGMAEVWKAFDTQLQRYVAIKVLHADLQNDPEFMTRFLREARMIASLHHPNIVQLHDFQVSRPPETQQTIAYMVMDYIEGPTLAEYIRSTSAAGKFPAAADLVHLFAAISGALDYAHQKGMIHRDIKPANILLDKRHTEHSPLGEPVLTDFGLAKMLYMSTGTSSGSWQGTALYISPEQVQGLIGNERSDLYSLGVILYELCTGRLPFRGESATAILAQHVSAMPPAPDSLNPRISPFPPALSAVILRSLAKQPEARFPSAPLMAAALAEALGLPVPENLNLPAYAPEVLNSPTLLNPTPAASSPERGLPSVTPFLGITPMTAPGVFPDARSGPQMTPLPPMQPGTPGTGVPAPVTPVPVAIPTVVLPPSLPVPGKPKRRRGLLIALVALVMLLLAGSGLGAAFWLANKGPVPTPTTQTGGHAFFVSSGQLSESSSAGIEDEFQISLQGVPDPSPGNSYYAWLLSDTPQVTKKIPKPGPVTFLLLGKLVVNAGTVNFLYPGDAQHDNLIASYSRLLITEGNANMTPVQPSLTDHSAWRYYAELPQAHNPDTRYFSVLGYLRQFLYEGATLHKMGIHGGIEDQLFRNAEKLLEWASSARDTWVHNLSLAQYQFIQRQAIRILDYLEGNVVVKAENIPLLVDPRLSQFPLVQLDQFKLIQDSGYPVRIKNQLGYMLGAPGVTPEMRPLAIQIRADASNLQKWFLQVYADAHRLFLMSFAQMQQPQALTILDDLQTQANYAFVGQIDPTTNQVQEGVIQIHDKMQLLANFDIRPYPSNQGAT